MQFSDLQPAQHLFRPTNFVCYKQGTTEDAVSFNLDEYGPDRNNVNSYYFMMEFFNHVDMRKTRFMSNGVAENLEEE